jgi:hypothetical protein
MRIKTMAKVGIITLVFLHSFISCSTSLSSNAKLSKIDINFGILEPNFDPDITVYKVFVAKSVSQISISTISEDKNTFVFITPGNYENLKMGTNIIKITVTSEDKTNNMCYKLYVTRADHIITIPNGNFEYGNTKWFSGSTSGTDYQYVIETDNERGSKIGALKINGIGDCYIQNSIEYFTIDEGGLYDFEFLLKINSNQFPVTSYLNIYKSTTNSFPTTIARSSSIISFENGLELLPLRISDVDLQKDDYIRIVTGIQTTTVQETQMYIDEMILLK